MFKLMVAVHKGAHNKEINGDIATGWKNAWATPHELQKGVLKGRPWVGCHLNDEPEGRRQQEFCGQSNAVVLDIDGDCTLEEFWQTETAQKMCAFTYTSCSHQPQEHRFRAVFPLDRAMQSIAEHKGAWMLVTGRICLELGKDKLKDKSGYTPEKLWFGNTEAIIESNPNADACVSRALLVDIAYEEPTYSIEGNQEATDLDIKKCEWLLRNFLRPSEDNEYDYYLRITRACASIGDAIEDAWVDWVNAGHHGQKRVNSNKFVKWKGTIKSSYLAIYGAAKRQDPDWAKKLPKELAYTKGTAVGSKFENEDPLPEEPEQKGPIGGQKRVEKNFDPNANEDPVTDPPKRQSNSLGRDGNARLADLQQVASVLPSLRKNTLTGAIEYDRDGETKVIQGDDLDTMTYEFVENYGVYIPEARIARAVIHLAKKKQYCPIRKYLERCEGITPHPEWDQLGKLYLGSDNPLATLVLQRFLIGAVARAYNRGCSMSWIPILVGPQGAGKSMLARSLVPADLFAEITTPLELLCKEPYRLHTGWLLELPEVDNFFTVKNIENFKNLITTRVDETRRPYERHPEKCKRPFVLIGTSNRNSFLVDSTGNRRFIPLELGHRFLIPWQQIQSERDSLWSAAIREFKADVPYEFTAGEIAEYSKYIQEFGDPDPWTDVVRNYLARMQLPYDPQTQKWSRKEVKVSDLLTTALNIDPKHQQRAEGRRITEILQSLGWRRLMTSRVDQKSGKKKGVRLWQQPDVEFENEFKLEQIKGKGNKIMPPDVDF